MMKIDLNADLGEGCGNDALLMPLISSANIACGFHAGDAQTMRESVRLALAHGVAIGAHPGFADRENFGRTAMQLPPETIYAETLYQVGALAAIARAEGGRLAHVKPHGMLYNQAAKDAALADAIAQAVKDFDASLILVGLAGSELIRAGARYELTTREEVFADRGYLADGALVPRSEPGALIEDDDEAVSRTLMMVQEGRVRSRDGAWATVNAQTVCLHGDARTRWRSRAGYARRSTRARFRSARNSERCRRPRGGVVKRGNRAQQLRRFANRRARYSALDLNRDKTRLAHVAVFHTQRFTFLCRRKIELFTYLFTGDIPGLHQLFQRVGHDVRVFHVEHKADIRELFLAVAVVDVMQQRDIKRAHIRLARCRHAAHHPFVKGVAGHDQRVLQLR